MPDSGRSKAASEPTVQRKSGLDVEAEAEAGDAAQSGADSEAETDAIPEAELLSEFDKLEKSAEG